LEAQEEIAMSHLKLNQVSFRYKEQSSWLLKHVSFEVESGSSVSLLGPSGSGKSTLFYLLGGMYTPDDGEIRLDNSPLSKSGLVGYMPQDSSLFPWMTVKENILLGYKLGNKKKTFSLGNWLDRAGLAEIADSYPHQLSGGMKQRVSFLRVLAGGHSLICLDEPFASLDALTRSKMQKWLASLMNADQTLLLITHQIEEAVLLTDHIYLFPNLLEGRPIEIRNPFPKMERFQVRKTPAFWEFVQQMEQQLEQQT
jgi:ABC-type nitrate/sulfonate/bicarbonate transport system ATPase subunit